MKKPRPIPPTCYFPIPGVSMYYRPWFEERHGVTDALQFAEEWDMKPLEAEKLATGRRFGHHGWLAIPQEKCHVCHPELPDVTGRELYDC